MINSNIIIEIDDLINDKNILDILIKTKEQMKIIKNNFISNNQEDFDLFWDAFMNKDANLTNNYLPILNLFKEILLGENVFYNNHIAETYDYMLNNISKSLNEFNSTLFEYINNIIENYDYFSFNYFEIFKNYSTIIEIFFDSYLSKIENLKVSNNFYFIPKMISNEIFLQKKKKIREIINQFSNNYNFESIGFKYCLEEEIDILLKKNYLKYTFNNTYDYFEIIANKRYNYVNKLLNNISLIKKNVTDKFNLISTNFDKYIKNINSYVKVDFIDIIDFKQSYCLHLLSDLNLDISNDLNEMNITETEDFLENNCTLEEIVNALFNNSNNNTCLNISGINVTFFLNKYPSLFVECKNHNFFNYSCIKLDKQGVENKIHLDTIISNIGKIIYSNIIDDNYLSDFIRNYDINDRSLEIDIKNYSSFFEKFEQNIQNPDLSVHYPKFLRDILIESFKVSYSNKIKSFVTNEVLDSFNILINDKIKIFIDFFSNKLKNDFDYYSLLLNQMEEIGDSSKSSIINLFSKMPKQLNESIYVLIEEEIFYYIDIFFREKKNIFINNFIKFYLNNELYYNFTTYNLEDYLKEFLLDNNFNKTLNNISSILITQIKSEIKNNIRNTIQTKMNSFKKQCDSLYDQIIIKLNKIKATKLSDEMIILVQLIHNHSNLLDNQNNKYLFVVGNKPFDVLNIFITTELEPPLSLILDKYDFIEKELLNRIQNIAQEFPDCVSEVKNNLLGNKIETIEDSTNGINPNIFDYENILIDDTESYLNKLIHFIYIEGLNTMDKSCEENYCGLPKKTFRRLDNREIINISKVYKGHPNLVDKTMIEKKINKKITVANKRKISSIPEFTPDMGPLSENDVVYYLSDLQNTILKLPKLYLGKEYSNLNSTTNKFLKKINVTYLDKLKLSFDLKIDKFKTILTDNSIE